MIANSQRSNRAGRELLGTPQHPHKGGLCQILSQMLLSRQRQAVLP
jgi:hypothetical protein